MDVYRHLLRLYPKSFRDEYGEAMRELHLDLRTHGGVRGVRLFTATTTDLVRSATRLRWEEGMAHHPGRTRGVTIILISIAFVGLAAMGPLLAVPALIALVVYMARHRDDVRSAGESTFLWIGLPVVGATLLLLGSVADALMGEDSAWWPLAVGPAIIGGAMLVVSLILMAVHEVRVRAFHRAELVPPATRAMGASIGLVALVVLFVAMGEDGGWLIFMIGVLTIITLAVLTVYALLLRFTRPSGAAAA